MFFSTIYFIKIRAPKLTCCESKILLFEFMYSSANTVTRLCNSFKPRFKTDVKKLVTICKVRRVKFLLLKRTFIHAVFQSNLATHALQSGPFDHCCIVITEKGTFFFLKPVLNLPMFLT